MRTYYKVNFSAFPESDSNKQLTKAISDFCHKYYFINSHLHNTPDQIQSHAGHLHIKRIIKCDIDLNMLWAYCEDGRVCEFFTGVELGQIQSFGYPYTHCINSEVYGKFYAFNMEQDDFVKIVEPRLADSKVIKPVLLQYFNLLASANATKDECIRYKESEEIRTKQSKLFAVEQFLNNRK